MLPTPRDLTDEVDREVARVVSRLATLGPRRLPTTTVARAAQRLADLAADAEGLPRRQVPELAPHGWADLVRVVVGDLRAVPDAVGPLTTARDVLVDLRRALP